MYIMSAHVFVCVSFLFWETYITRTSRSAVWRYGKHTQRFCEWTFFDMKNVKLHRCVCSAWSVRKF